MASAPTSTVYLVTSAKAVDSVHASIGPAGARLASLGKGWKLETFELQGGTVQPEEEKPVPKTVKTKPPSEQRAANAEKPTKSTDSSLPDNVKALLAGSGDALSGKMIVVTGVPPTIGRKSAEALVKAYGGKLTKSLSKNTDFVVVGNDAGPKKLEQIEGLGIETLDEDQFIEILEGSSSGVKRGAEEDDEDEEKPAKAKKSKK